MQPQLDEAREFEKAVRLLLSLSGYKITQEVLLGHKKIDALAEEYRMGRRIVIAVECKNYSTPITQTQIVQIYSDYIPLYKNSQIDEILLVTVNGLTAGAAAFVEETREMYHLTYDDLRNSLLDFRSYLSGLVSEFESDGLYKYYVQMRFQDSEAFAYDTIIDWMNSREITPLAILGSYGMGKTTLARYSCYQLAKKHLDGKPTRIPIFLRLGEISSEQSLEGFLGKAFTATNIVRNYSYSLFMELNRNGMFILFLDGFDEMKHAMTWEEFKFNFSQINRLIDGNSKVVLLGRPTAFLSDEEHNYALHGIKSISGTTYRCDDWPDYRECHLSAFNKEEVTAFLTKYFGFQKSIARDKTEKRKIDDILHRQLEKISGKQLSDIARRPVQLRILAEVLPQWNEDIDKLTVAILYSIFIDIVLEREQRKLARKLFNIDKRRSFARDLAYWLWINGKDINVSAESLPDFLFERYCKKNEKLEAIRRDLVSACFLNRKLGGTLYFPHRSFQEYLVAEYMVDRLATNQMTFSQADASANAEILDFIREMIGPKDFVKWVGHFANAHGSLSIRFLRTLSSSDETISYCIEKIGDASHPWFILLVALDLIMNEKSMVQNRRYHEILTTYPEKAARQISANNIVTSMFAILATYQDRDYLESWGYAGRIGKCIEVLCEIGWRSRHTDPTSWQYKKIATLLNRIVISKKRDLYGKGFVLDVGGVYKSVIEILKGNCFVSDWIVGDGLVIEGVSLPKKIYSWNYNYVEKLRKFQSENFELGA